MKINLLFQDRFQFNYNIIEGRRSMDFLESQDSIQKNILCNLTIGKVNSTNTGELLFGCSDGNAAQIDVYNYIYSDNSIFEVNKPNFFEQAASQLKKAELPGPCRWKTC